MLVTVCSFYKNTRTRHQIIPSKSSSDHSIQVFIIRHNRMHQIRQGWTHTHTHTHTHGRARAHTHTHTLSLLPLTILSGKVADGASPSMWKSTERFLWIKANKGCCQMRPDVVKFRHRQISLVDEKILPYQFVESHRTFPPLFWRLQSWHLGFRSTNSLFSLKLMIDNETYIVLLKCNQNLCHFPAWFSADC